MAKMNIKDFNLVNVNEINYRDIFLYKFLNPKRSSLKYFKEKRMKIHQIKF